MNLPHNRELRRLALRTPEEWRRKLYAATPDPDERMTLAAHIFWDYSEYWVAADFSWWNTQILAFPVEPTPERLAELLTLAGYPPRRAAHRAEPPSSQGAYGYEHLHKPPADLVQHARELACA